MNRHHNRFSEQSLPGLTLTRRARAALIMPGPMVGDISGSAGGVTFARNRGGLYARNRTTPLNPQSVRQTEIRGSLAAVVNRWTTVLTESQRASWEAYAANVPVQNRLGQQRFLSGQQMYVRGNVLLRECGMAFADAGPTTFTAGRSEPPQLTLNAMANTVVITSLGGIPIDTLEIGMFLAQGPPQNPARNFFKAPFRRVNAEEFDDAGAQLPTPAIPLAFPITVGQAVFFRTAYVEADGRVGVPVIQRFLVA